MKLSAYILIFLLSTSAAVSQAADVCGALYNQPVSRYIGGNERLEQLMSKGLSAYRDEITRQDLQILTASRQGKHSQTVYIQFVGNTKLNRVIKDSMVPDFFSADLVDTTYRFFEKNPDLGALTHYNYRDVVVQTSMSRQDFEAKLKDFILSEVALRYSTSQITPGSPLSKEWIMDHIRLGFGADPQAAFNEMKIGRKNAGEVFQQAQENRSQLMRHLGDLGVGEAEAVRFVRYDLPYPDRTANWLNKAGIPERLHESLLQQLRKLRDDYFLFDFLPAPEASPSVIARAKQLYRSQRTQEAIDLLAANGLASWRLQRANALAALREMGNAIIISSDQSKLGLANFREADQALAQKNPPSDLSRLDVPNAKGLYQHHTWLKNEMEKIIGIPGSIKFWLIGDDATWILPSLSSTQLKLVAQYLNQSSSLYYSISKVESSMSPEQMARVLTQSRQDLVDHKPTTPKPIGWPVGRMAVLTQDKDVYSLDGQPVRRIGDAWGLANNGVFVYEKAGSARLFKVLRPEYAVDLMAKSDPKAVSEPELLLALLNREYAGMVRAQSLGGPKLYSVGFVRLPNGQTSFYIEMENMFAGLPSKTLKTYIRDAQGDLQELRENATHPGGKASSVPYIKQMADMIVHAYENGIVPNDPDFIFYAGQMRWLDSGAWEATSGRTHPFVPVSKRPPAVQVYQRLSAAESSQQTANKFRDAFSHAVRMSQSLSLSQKQQLLSGFSEPAQEPPMRQAN